MSFISLFEIIRVVVPEPCFFKFLHQWLKQLLQIPNAAKGTATFINGPASLLNNDPTN